MWHLLKIKKTRLFSFPHFVPFFIVDECGARCACALEGTLLRHFSFSLLKATDESTSIVFGHHICKFFPSSHYTSFEFLASAWHFFKFRINEPTFCYRSQWSRIPLITLPLSRAFTPPLLRLVPALAKSISNLPKF